MDKIAVVILNFNGHDLLREFLPAVVAFSDDARIIVADNCSTDGSAALVAAEFPSIDVIKIPENLGFCGGYNFSLKEIEAEYYVLLNSDVAVTEGWLTPLIKVMDSDAMIAAVQPRILSYRQKELFEYAGAGGGWIDTLGYPFCRGRIFDAVEPDKGQYNDTLPVFWATGACLAIRSKVFWAMGGFDEDFFAHMEEIDLCWKLQRAGQQVYYVGESKVYHVGGGTLSKLNPQKTYLNFKNGLSLIFKNMQSSELVWKLPVRMGLDWLALLTFLGNGSGKNAWAVLKAHAHFLAGIRREWRKRKLFKGPGFAHKPRQIYRGSIVLDYFIRERKNFKELRF